MPINMSNEIFLIHLTKRIETIKSILNIGFIPTHNKTRVWDDIFGELGIEIPDVKNGMVCFTEIHEDLTDFKNSVACREFGDFGIVVDLNWALDHGLRKIAYIAKGGEVYENLKNLLNLSYPRKAKFTNDLFSEEENYEYNKGLFNDPNLPDYFTTPLFSLIVNLMQWVETDKHFLENEYRIRSKNTFGGIDELDKKEQITILGALALSGIIDYNLKIKPENILHFVCPVEDQDEFHEMLRKTNFNEVRVVTY